MGEFISALLRYSFLQNAVAAGILASAASGVVGTYVVVKRITFISGGIAHAVLGGMGGGLLFWCGPGARRAGSRCPGRGSVGFSQFKSEAARRYDHRCSVGCGHGLRHYFHVTHPPGYNVDLMSFLFGNILMVTDSVLRTLLILDGAILAVVVVFYRQFMLIVFDEEQAHLRGAARRTPLHAAVVLDCPDSCHLNENSGFDFGNRPAHPACRGGGNVHPRTGPHDGHRLCLEFGFHLNGGADRLIQSKPTLRGSHSDHRRAGLFSGLSTEKNCPRDGGGGSASGGTAVDKL